jgi:hypothetical protein
MADDAQNIIADTKAMAAAKAKADLDTMTAKPVPEADLAEEVEEFEEKQNDFQAMYNAGGKFKKGLDEIVGQSGRVEERESIRKRPERSIEEVEEILTSPEVGKEVEGYVEKVEKESELAGGVTDDYVQQVMLGSSGNPKANVTLPLTEEEMNLALHLKVWQSIRWLAEWCVRQVKLLQGRARYKS